MPLFVREKVGVLLADAPNVSEAVLVAVSVAVRVTVAVSVIEFDIGDEVAEMDRLVVTEALTVALASTDTDEDAVLVMLTESLATVLALGIVAGDTVPVVETDCAVDTDGDVDADDESDGVQLLLPLSRLVILVLGDDDADDEEVRD